MRQDNSGVYVCSEDFEAIKKEFELPNLVKQKQKQRGCWWWNKLPDTVKHYEYNPITDEYKIPVWLVWYMPNKTKRNLSFESFEHPTMSYSLRENQETAVSSLLRRPYWLLHASTGTGKTVMICEITRRLKRKTLIVCDSLSRMTQMIADIQTILWVTPDYVGGTKKKSFKPTTDGIVVLNIDSRSKLEWRMHEFGTILLDEADRYLQADARREWVGTLNPEFMYALTGTVRLNDVHNGVFKIYYGPKTEFLLKHFTPTYYQVLTEHTVDSTYDASTEFHLIKEDLYNDYDRNKLILDTITKTLWNRKWIVFCQYVDHAKYLVTELTSRWIASRMIIGEVKDSDRELIRKELESMPAPCLLIWSVQCIGRGFNLPELSAAYLTTCEKFDSNIEQYIGRIIRQHEGKKSCDFYDFVDTSWVLYWQAKKRVATAKREFPWITIKFL